MYVNSFTLTRPWDPAQGVGRRTGHEPVEDAAVDAANAVGYVYGATLVDPGPASLDGREVGPVPEEEARAGGVTSVEELEDLTTRTQELSTVARDLMRVLDAAIEQGRLEDEPQPQEPQSERQRASAGAAVAHPPAPETPPPRDVEHDSEIAGRHGQGVIPDDDIRMGFESFSSRLGTLYRELDGLGGGAAPQRLRSGLKEVFDRTFERFIDRGLADPREDMRDLGTHVRFDKAGDGRSLDRPERKDVSPFGPAGAPERRSISDHDSTREGSLAGMHDVLRYFERGVERVIGSRGVLLDIMA